MTKAQNKSPFSEVAPREAVDKLEKDILKYWERDRIFDRCLAARAGGELFTFYDGPPYATGKPHYGHVLQSALKDTILRYKTMRGFYAPRRVGWDTHGLPVEVLVEKELGLATKKEVESYGIEKFNERCRQSVFRHINDFQAILRRLGRWADYTNSYATLDRDYMGREWWAFKELWNKKLVYKDYRTTPYCIRCATPLSNFETGMGYRDRTDMAVYVRFRVMTESSLPGTGKHGPNQKLSLLVWTTTPWTLPANVAVAFNPDIVYVSVQQGKDEYVVALDRVAAVFGEGVDIGRKWTALEVANLRYEPIFPEVNEGVWKLVPADYATTEEGTGFVHLAPAYGVADAELARRAQLPSIRNVDESGRYLLDVKPPWLAAVNIWAANKKIVDDLNRRGLLFKVEPYSHSYPHCWRCDEPLIYYALDTWFVQVTALKQRMLALNEKINWIPGHIKHGRFAKGIQSAPDWAVSRNRFWSTPIPVWECDNCRRLICVGSVAELRDLSGVSEETVQDIHRPYVDKITWPHAMSSSQDKSCAGTMRRVPEVLDVWFDSGAMPYTQKQGFPADFIVESIEMTRAWFYVLHVLAVAIKDSPAYKNVIGSGIIFGADGNKLSKKLNNYPEIEPTLEKFGADTLRLFFLSSTLGEPYIFSEKELQHLHRSFYTTLWNVYSFFVRYANTHHWRKPARTQKARQRKKMLDLWILAKLKLLERDVIVCMDTYSVDQAARMFIPFVDDLSNWYVRRSRSRFQHPESANLAFPVLYEVLIRLSKLLAPFMPFVSEAIWRNLTGEASVHLSTLQAPEELDEKEKNLVLAMAKGREIVSAGLADRAKKGIKVRQPLQCLSIRKSDEDLKLSAELAEIICDEVNVKKIAFESVGETLAWVDGKITPELRREGWAREIIRHGQVLRRQAGYALDERIITVLVTDDPELLAMLARYKEMIMSALQTDTIVTEKQRVDVADNIAIDKKPVYLGVRR